MLMLIIAVFAPTTPAIITFIASAIITPVTTFNR